MTDKPLAEKLGWQHTGTQHIYQNQWLRIRQDSVRRAGYGETTYTYIEHPGSVVVVPYSVDGRIILIRSYRYTLDQMCWEVPAGGLEADGGEDGETAAHRELLEEIGGVASRLDHLGTYFLASGFANYPACYLATGVQESCDPTPGAFEQIVDIHKWSVPEVHKLLENGEITDGDSVLALLLALPRLMP